MTNPTAVSALIYAKFDIRPLSVEHKSFGHNSTTFEVTLPHRSIIVRTNEDPTVFADTADNLKILAQLGLPVFQPLLVDLSKSEYPFTFMVLDKIPGRDLRFEIEDMSRAELTALAEQIVEFQITVGALPMGDGFGWASIGRQGDYSSWQDLINAPAMSSEVPNYVLHQELIQRLAYRKKEHIDYFSTIKPICFLDDITIKNVIVKNGVLQGLVDFDTVCYGDPLLMVGLTKTGIVSDVGRDHLFYTDEICRFMELTIEQRKIVDFYASMHALDFLRRIPDTDSSGARERLLTAAEEWLDP